MSLNNFYTKRDGIRRDFLFLLIVFFGLLVWKTDLMLEVHDKRFSTVEPDDIIGYMTQGVAWNCRLGQSCPGLDDLRHVLQEPSDEEWVKYYRFREFHRLLYDYAPLYSLTSRFLRFLSSSWEEASNRLAITEMVLVQVGITWFLLVLFRPVPAAIGLLLSSLFWINYIFVPFPWLFSLAFGSGAMATILQRRDRWLLFWTLSTVAMLFHPFGRLTFLAGIFFYFIQFRHLNKQQLIRFSLGSIVIFLFIVLVDWLLNGFVGHGSNPHGALKIEDIITGIGENFTILLAMIIKWVNRFGGGVNFLWLLSTALFLLKPQLRFRSLLILVISALALIASTFLVLPGYPGTLFLRVSLPIIIIFCGFLGLATWEAVKNLVSVVFYLKNRVQIVSWLNIVVSALFVVGALQSFSYLFSAVPASASHYVSHTIQRKNFFFDVEQFKNLDRVMKKQDRILFLSEEASYYFYVQTRFQHLATNAATLDDKMQAEYTRLETWPPRFISFWNPLQIGRVDLAVGEAFLLKGEGELAFKGGLAVRTSSNNVLSARISITTDQGQRCDVDISNDGGWQSIPCVVPEIKNIRVERVGDDVGGLISIVGVRVGKSSLNWPWNSSVALIPDANQEEVSVVFNESDLSYARFPCPVKVINDLGSFVLAQRQCPDI
jgi:hypothetical protein